MHVLDNMIWNALTTGNKDIALIGNDVARYRTDIAPFGAMKEFSEENFQKLYEFIPADGKVAVSSLDKRNYDEKKWKLLLNYLCSQMVYTNPIHEFKTKNSSLLTPLTDEHIPQMLELTALTKPGPFLQRTIEFGNYFGIFIDDRLAAMTGQRMHPVPYMEVSAVCTHPDFRGKGYAKACMLHVMRLILDNGFIPFLHVLTSNRTAIQLYESIGFETRIELNIDMLKKVDGQ